MHLVRVAAVVLVASVLSACGGGSGGSSGGIDTVAPPPPPPPADNIADLKADETFTGPAATSRSEFNTVSGTTVSSGGAPATLSVTYDAESKSYTIALPDRTQVFSADDSSPGYPGETHYQKSWEEGTDRVTLVTTPYSDTTSNQYVGLGYWQRSSHDADRQHDQFATFVYGFDTPAAAMPRTGRANFGIDVFGLWTVPGYEPSVFQGRGTFDVDFMAGIFSTQTYLTETELLSGEGVTGGGIELIGAGTLSSGDSSFSGNVTVGGWNADLTGPLAGQFYGPDAEEVGASFSATNADGATAAGSFTGQRGNGPAVNLTLTDLVTQQLFYAEGTALFIRTFDDSEGADVSTYRMTGQFNDRTSGNFSFGPGMSSMAGGEYTTASIVSSDDPNFTVYEKAFGGRDVRLELYKVGQANSELALTYATLGRWQSADRNGVVTEQQYHHFVYGLETPARLLAARTGSARYEGVVYGAAGNRTTGAHYDVRGTSHFDVDFTDQSYSGALALNGRSADGTVDFGSYDFAGDLAAWTTDSVATLTHGASAVGEISTRFYGPTGEEIGGSFGLVVPEGVHPGGTVIAGATVARRR